MVLLYHVLLMCAPCVDSKFYTFLLVILALDKQDRAVKIPAFLFHFFDRCSILYMVFALCPY